MISFLLFWDKYDGVPISNDAISHDFLYQNNDNMYLKYTVYIALVSFIRP